MDEDRDEFFNNLNKFFEMMQHEVAKVLRDNMENSDFGEEGTNFMNQGFKVELGPDGPRFSPVSENELHNFNQHAPSWEKPYTEVNIADEGRKYQIIAEVPGIETDDVKIHFNNNKKIMIQGEFDDYKYRKGLMLKYPVDTKSANYIVRNGVLEIFLNIIDE